MDFAVVAIDLDLGRVVLEDAIVPIVSFLDADGDECDKEDATQLVCGDEAHGYIVIYASQLKPRVLH